MSECVRVFGRNLVVLFKLVLLERAVLLYHSPVAPVVRTIASLLALLPHTLPHGMHLAAAARLVLLKGIGSREFQNSLFFLILFYIVHMFRNHILKFQEHQCTRTRSERCDRENVFLLYFSSATVSTLDFNSTVRIHYTSDCGEINCVGISN